jgi:putative ABC transport system permease protein
MLGEYWRRIASFFRREKFNRELDEEMRLHRELRQSEQREAGAFGDDAHFAARQRFGNELRLREESQDMWGWSGVENLAHDIRFGVRMLRKNPGFTTVAVLTLALGIGANTAIYSITNSLLLRPLPYQDASRIMMLSESNQAENLKYFGISAADLTDWKQRDNGFEKIAAYTLSGMNLAADHPERVVAANVQAEFFEVFGIKPVLGRLFLPDEDRAGKANVVVISGGLRRRLFGESAEFLGRTVDLGGVPYAIVGVVGDDFQFPAGVDVWRPLTIASDLNRRGARWLSAVGLTRAGISQKQAAVRLGAIQQSLAQEYPNPDAGWSADVMSLQEAMVGDFRTPLVLLWGAVALLLVMASVNIANLLLARSTLRKREIAVRCALGAKRWRVVQQLVVESALLGTIGGVLGSVMGSWMLQALVSISPASLPRRGEISMDGTMFVLAVLFSIFTSVLFGLAPAWVATRQEPREALKDGSRSGVASVGITRTRNALVISEVALAIVLLTGAGVLLRSLARILANSPGFDAHNVLIARIAPPQIRESPQDSESTFITKYFGERDQTAMFYQRALERLTAIPGVESAGAINRLPLTGNWWTEELSAQGGKEASDTGINVRSRVITPGFLETMRVPLIAGRNISESDTAKSQRVTVINAGLAHTLWNGTDPLGKLVCLCKPADNNPRWLAVVGVVGDVRFTGLKLAPEPVVYVPFAQATTGLFPDWGMDLVVRTSRDPLAFANSVRGEFNALDNTLPLFQIRTLEQLISGNVEQERFLMFLFCVFAAAALLLATVGIYGVISYLVTSRTQEIGIRLALGASPTGILRMVIGRGTLLALEGVLIGTTGALFLTRLMSSLLYGIAPWDFLTLAGVWIVTLAVSAVACYIPGRRAMRIDPIIALRYE